MTVGAPDVARRAQTAYSVPHTETDFMADLLKRRQSPGVPELQVLLIFCDSGDLLRAR